MSSLIEPRDQDRSLLHSSWRSGSSDRSRHSFRRAKLPATSSSAQDSLRLGLWASTQSIGEHEDADALAALRCAMLARHQPLDAAEAHWVEELVFVAWWQQRLRAVEDQVLVQAGAVDAGAGAAGLALPSLATLIRYRGRLDRDWRRAGEELAALRRDRQPLAEPRQLRLLAAQIEHAQALAATFQPPRHTAECTNEFTQPRTNEPTEAFRALATAPTIEPGPVVANEPTAVTSPVLPPARAHEPRHTVPPLPEPGMNEPTRSLYRHQRRALRAMARLRPRLAA
jgi:hypothetical protein